MAETPIYNTELFSFFEGKLYYGDNEATADQMRFHNAYYNKKTGEYDLSQAKSHKDAKSYVNLTGSTRNSTKFKIGRKTQNRFPTGTDFYQYRNLDDSDIGPKGNFGWGSPLGLKSGEVNNEVSRRYKLPDGTIKKDDQKARFGEKIGRGATTILNGGDEFLKHLLVTQHALTIAVFNFKVAMGKRAVKVFQGSFDKQRFNSAGTSHWAGLADYTKLKREKRGTFPKQNPILREYLDLVNSIVEEPYKDGRRVTTKPIPANAAKHKKYTGCWAYLHNEGVGTYGKGFNGRKPKPYIQRQFIGFSTEFDFDNQFMNILVKRYLFDSVFLTKSASVAPAPK